ALVNLLIDVGPALPDTPSWVPDWSAVRERMWLPSTYIYDSITDDIKAASEPHVAFSGGESTTAAIKIGIVTFASGPFERVGAGDDLSSSTVQRTLSNLSHWLAHIRKDVPSTDRMTLSRKPSTTFSAGGSTTLRPRRS